jgi:hypothetical protein
MIDSVFKIQKNLGAWSQILTKPCLQSSEVDQELEYEVCKTIYEVMIWVQDGLITTPTNLIIRSRNIGFTYLERHTYMRGDVLKP